MDQNEPNPYAEFGRSPPPPPPPSDLPPGEADKDARMWATLAHLLGIFTGFVGPLIIWLVKKDESPFVEDQAREALNFQITLMIAHLLSGLLWCFLIGMVFTLGLVIATIVLGILATVQASKGVAYRYPICLRIIK